MVYKRLGVARHEFVIACRGTISPVARFVRLPHLAEEPRQLPSVLRVVGAVRQRAEEGYGSLIPAQGGFHLRAVRWRCRPWQPGGRGAVKLAPLRRRRRGERGAVKLVSGGSGKGCPKPLRRRSRGEGRFRQSP